MSVSLHAGAELELVETAAYYAREAGAGVAEAFISEFERSTALLREHPKLGTPWRGRVRRLPLRRFPYSLVYHLRGEVILVLAIAHQRRKPGFWRGRS